MLIPKRERCCNVISVLYYFSYLIGEKKTGVNFSRIKLLVGKKISDLWKIGHFSLTKFYTSQVSQKALFIPLKFYFKNRKLINGQVNWFIKINVNVEVFFFTTTVSVTDQFWLISHRKFPFFNYTSLPNATEPDFSIINLIIFFKISVIWFLIRRKNNWEKLLVGVNFSRVKLLVVEKYWSPLKNWSLFTAVFFTDKVCSWIYCTIFIYVSVYL